MNLLQYLRNQEHDWISTKLQIGHRFPRRFNCHTPLITYCKNKERNICFSKDEDDWKFHIKKFKMLPGKWSNDNKLFFHMSTDTCRNSYQALCKSFRHTVGRKFHTKVDNYLNTQTRLLDWTWLEKYQSSYRCLNKYIMDFIHVGSVLCLVISKLSCILVRCEYDYSWWFRILRMPLTFWVLKCHRYACIYASKHCNKLAKKN